MWEGHWRRGREGTVGECRGRVYLWEGGRGWILAKSVVGQQTVATSVVSQQTVATSVVSQQTVATSVVSQ